MEFEKANILKNSSLIRSDAENLRVGASSLIIFNVLSSILNPRVLASLNALSIRSGSSSNDFLEITLINLSLMSSLPLKGSIMVSISANEMASASIVKSLKERSA